MSAWTSDELATLTRADELRIAGRREDGSLRKLVIIWMVTLDEELYVRSVNGPDAAWFRGTQLQGFGRIESGRVQKGVAFTGVTDLDDALDDVYNAKYRGYPSAAAAITSATARTTTLRVDPA